MLTTSHHPPSEVDRLIVHKFDPLVPAPGGIDTCIRGLIRYAPEGTSLAIVGVAGTSSAGSRTGRWELHDVRGREVHFLPVAEIDPGDQQRRVPHSLRVAAGAWRQRRVLPKARVVQAHRSDVAVAVADLIPGARRTVFIHTQAEGIVGANSDSFWRKAASIQNRVERLACRRADDIRVFNEDYAKFLQLRHPQARFSPTWWDPELIRARSSARPGRDIVWVGRMERPKNPELALNAFARLVEREPEQPWTLTMVGGGTELAATRRSVEATGDAVSRRVTITGRVDHDSVMRLMSEASVFLMTSVPGYEGYPRGLVESLATGLPAVVTHGADTGHLVHDGVNGFVCDYDAEMMAGALTRAALLDPSQARASVEELSAPALVTRLFA